MKIERKEGDVVVLHYGDGVGAKYQFGNNAAIHRVDRTSKSIIREEDKEAELTLAQNALKMFPETLKVERLNVNEVTTEEVVADDTSLRTVFNFETKKAFQTSLDNNEGVVPVAEYSFEDFEENAPGKAKLEIARQARGILPSEFRF